MKTKYILPVLACISLFGCMKDKGNYKLHDINEITISGIVGDYDRVPGETLSITVELTYSLEPPKQEPSFLWELNGKVINEEKDLELVIENIKYGKNDCRFTVTDNDTGMKYFANFSLNVINGINWGYYFLTEKPDHSSILAYLPAIWEEKLRDSLEVLNLSFIEDYPLGDNPSQIDGYFAYNLALEDYYWTFGIATHDGDTPVLETNNGTFTVTAFINTNSFIDKTSGYIFDPEFIGYTGYYPYYFISNGKLIIFNQGLLYRPAKHDKDYYWTHPVLSDLYRQIFVFDKYSQKFYALNPSKTDPVKGTVTDRYAYDMVMEITFPGMEDNPPSFDGHYILGSHSAEMQTADDDDVNIIHVVTGDSNGIYITKLTMSYIKETSIETPEQRLEFPNVRGIDEYSQAILHNAWYVSAGNKIYKSPQERPEFKEFITIPSEYGQITRMGLTAYKSLLVVATYNDAGDEETNGSIFFFNLETGEIVEQHENVMYKCVSMLCANTNPNNGGVGDSR